MHSFTSVLVHCVWSTKNREPSLHSKLRERSWSYLRGIASENRMKALAIGGAADHVHMLVSLPATVSVAKAHYNFSKAIHPNGSTKRFLKCVRLNGRKVTVRSASVSQLLMPRLLTFEIKPSTIESELFGRSLRRCCGSMASILTKPY